MAFSFAYHPTLISTLKFSNPNRHYRYLLIFTLRLFMCGSALSAHVAQPCTYNSVKLATERSPEMKRKIFLIFMLLTALCLSACGNKTDTSDIEETTPVESTEDPFSLGGIEVEVDTTQPTEATEPAVEVEVIETDADGSKTSLYSDGSIRHTSNIDNLPEVDKLTEEESIFLQAVVANWDADAALSSDMLRDNINTDNLPSLSVAIVYET